MIERIKAMLGDRPADRGSAALALSGQERLQLAAASLLVEAARMEDGIDEAERHRIGELVRWRFKLSEQDAEDLVEAAVAATRDTVQWYGFTATVRESFDEVERVQLIEMLWDVAYADGQVQDLEASLLRRIAGLLHVTDRDSGAARKRAMARHGLEEDRAGRSEA